MERNKNILHVVNIFFVVPYFLGNQLRYFRERGWKEHIICSPSSELLPYAQDMCFEVQEVEVLRKIAPWKDLKAVVKTAKYIRDHHIGIVTGHTPKGAIIAMTAAWLARVPKRIYFRHGLVYETASGFKRKLLMTVDKLASKMATHVVCVSPSLLDLSIKDHLNPPSKQRILHKGTCNGMDVHRFSRENIDQNFVAKLQRDLHIKEANQVIGYVGRLVRDKGIIELVDSFKIIQDSNPNVKLLLVGMLEQRDALPEETVSILEQNPAIIMTGYVDNRQIQNYYALMDCLVLPSYREGFGMSLAEASSMEIPVITTKVTGCINAIEENVTGFFTNREPADMAEKICRLLDDESLRKRMGAAGRKWVKENFAEELVWRDIEKLYNE